MDRLAPDLSPMPDQLVEQQELRDRVHEVLSALTPQHRAVLTLVDLEGIGYGEAAQIIGCPIGTIKSRVARAREAFATRFQPYVASN
jgi:RNA polymerase sigma-70 factor, ECF subfamily